MNAHARAVVPTFGIMEIDPPVVPWSDELITQQPATKRGHLVLRGRPWWRDAALLLPPAPEER